MEPVNTSPVFGPKTFEKNFADRMQADAKYKQELTVQNKYGPKTYDESLIEASIERLSVEGKAVKSAGRIYNVLANVFKVFSAISGTVQKIKNLFLFRGFVLNEQVEQSRYDNLISKSKIEENLKNINRKLHEIANKEMSAAGQCLTRKQIHCFLKETTSFDQSLKRIVKIVPTAKRKEVEKLAQLNQELRCLMQKDENALKLKDDKMDKLDKVFVSKMNNRLLARVFENRSGKLAHYKKFGQIIINGPAFPNIKIAQTKIRPTLSNLIANKIDQNQKAAEATKIIKAENEAAEKAAAEKAAAERAAAEEAAAAEAVQVKGARLGIMDLASKLCDDEFVQKSLGKCWGANSDDNKALQALKDKTSIDRVDLRADLDSLTHLIYKAYCTNEKKSIPLNINHELGRLGMLIFR